MLQKRLYILVVKPGNNKSLGSKILKQEKNRMIRCWCTDLFEYQENTLEHRKQWLKELRWNKEMIKEMT